MTIEPRAQEIARIEQELEILRSNYASLGYWGGVMRKFCLVALPISVVLVIAIVVWIYVRTDIVYFAFFFGIISVVGILAWISGGPNRPSQPFRWIDIATPLNPFERLKPNPRSEAEIVEEHIAVREKRLAELKRGLQ